MTESKLPQGPQGTSANQMDRKKKAKPFEVVLMAIAVAVGAMSVFALGVVGLVIFTCSR